MQFRITSARYCCDEMKCFENYREAFDKFNAKIMSEIDTGNVNIIVEFNTIEELEEFAQLVEHSLHFPRRIRGKLSDIWIKDDYME